MILKNIILALLLTISMVALSKTANAQNASSCQPIYGGGEACMQKGKLILNKTIQHPKTSELVDSLIAQDSMFSPDQTITFHLTITNTNTQIVKNISVSDIIPQYLTFSSGQGEYDSKTNTFSFKIDSLNPGESQTRIVQMKTYATDKLPANQQATCTLNQARATSGSENISEDNAMLCIQNAVLGAETAAQQGPTTFPAQMAKQTPATGPGALALIALIPAGLTGWYLRIRSLHKATST